MTSLSEADVLAIIADTSKVIEGDIVWQQKGRRGRQQTFRAEIRSDVGPETYIDGYINPGSQKLSFTLVLKYPIRSQSRRIYGLDIGREHENKGEGMVGATHKTRWRDEHRDRWAYAPPDITAPWSDPVLAWKQFCTEANLRHTGTMITPNYQEEMLL